MSLVLSAGDPSGIGPEIALKAWIARAPAFTYLGCARHLNALALPLGVPVTTVMSPDQGAEVFADALPVIDLPLPGEALPGLPSPENAAQVIEAIRHGVTLCQSGAASALVTNPINKRALKDGAGFAFPGHTEFLAELSGVERPVMMLAGPELRVVPVTIHIALKDVPDALTPDLVEETLRITHAELASKFGIAEPRIAVAGLNPHAGEGGVMGDEEVTVITPVITKLAAEGIAVSGPYSGDTMFHAAARNRYDAAVCMYHDQALIPLKTLGFSDGVNVTLGLPFIRTSPDHGTAYDIAGRGVADPESLIYALRLAADLAGRAG